MAREMKPENPWIDLLHLLWRQPLFAIPFALFFGTLNGGGGFEVYWAAYIASLYFTFTIGILIWAVMHFVVPRIRTSESRGPAAILAHMMPYAAAGIFGSFLAAFLIRITIAPNFLGGANEVASLAMFSILSSPYSSWGSRPPSSCTAR